MELAQVRLQLSEFLSRYDWDYFFTVTCRVERHDALALLRDVSNELPNSFNSRAFIVIEPHKTSTGLHAHGIYGCEFPKPDLTWQWRAFFHRFGRSKVERINSKAEVYWYLSKYLAKDERWEYEYWGNGW